MAHRDRPFSDTEKVNLLAEIIKTSAVPPSALLQVIYDHQVVPQWADVSRPPGRSATECEQAFSDLRSSHPHLAGRVPPPSYPPPTGVAPPPPQQYRPWPELAPPAPPPGQGRSLQPRPQGVPSNVYSPSGAGSPYATTPTEGQFKKRGRPTNAEVELRKQEAEARGEVYAPQRSRKRSKAQQSTPQSVKRLSLGTGTSARPTEEPSSAGESKHSSLLGTSSRSPPPQSSPGTAPPPFDRPPSSLEPRQPLPAPPTALSFTSADRYRSQPPRHRYSPPPAPAHLPPHSEGLTLPRPTSASFTRGGVPYPPTTTGSNPAPAPR